MIKWFLPLVSNHYLDEILRTECINDETDKLIKVKYFLFTRVYSIFLFNLIVQLFDE